MRTCFIYFMLLLATLTISAMHENQSNDSVLPSQKEISDKTETIESKEVTRVYLLKHSTVKKQLRFATNRKPKLA